MVKNKLITIICEVHILYEYSLNEENNYLLQLTTKS